MADLFDIAVARKLSGGSGGGGGSSDFSTAQVTITSTNAEALIYFYSTVYDETLNANILTGVVKISSSVWMNEYEWTGVQNTNTEVLFLSDNTAFNAYANTVVCTGDAVAVYNDESYSWNITVTGDCTITIS